MRRVALFLCFLLWSISSEAVLSLRENLHNAKVGDFLVTSHLKHYTLIHINAKQDNILTIEEITVPMSRITRTPFSWKEWVKDCAPGQTSWILYLVNISTGEIQRGFSLSQKMWLDISKEGSFLPTLLRLQFSAVPEGERKRVGRYEGGSIDRRPLWQPKMVVEGQVIAEVAFSEWRARWPSDGGPLSGKLIEVFVPEESNKYPSYFPYWMQVRGAAGARGTIYVIDSGSNLTSPAKFPIM